MAKKSADSQLRREKKYYLTNDLHTLNPPPQRAQQTAALKSSLRCLWFAR